MSLAGVAGLVMVFGSGQTSYAASSDPVDTVVTALHSASVYVEPGTPGTTSDTAATLASNLQAGDHIVLVMLSPATAVAIGDPDAFAHEVSDKLGHDDVVGVMAGTQSVAYSDVLPKGTALDLMSRAASVSTNGPETLGTFTRNVHQYEAEHPQASVTVSSHSQSSSHVMPLVFGGAALGVALIAAVAFRLLRRSGELGKLRTTPSRLRPYVEQLVELQLQVDDSEVRETLLSCRNDLDRYFSKYASVGDDQVLEDSLQKMVEVLKQYIDIQDNQRYYTNPIGALASGKKAMTDFSEHILESCRQGSDVALVGFEVNTEILQAQRM